MDSLIYADSSFLVSLLCQDANSDAACAYMERVALPLIFTPLHRIEVRNALRNATARGLITDSAQRSAFRQIESDLREGVLIHTQIDWTDVMRQADELSEKHSGSDGQRTIDLLHVAMALECRAKMFLSFDKRQRGLVKSAGLKVVP